jgi:hypothetical protein
MTMQPSPVNLKRVSTGVLAFVLWLATAILGLEALYIVYQLGLFGLVWLGVSSVRAARFAPLVLFGLALAYLVFIIGTTEFHRTHIGQAGSWKLFGWTFGIELALLLVGWRMDFLL